MNAPLFFRCLIALVVWYVPLCASAQIEPPADLGYDPPEGWKYVRRLDSLSFIFYVHNDSIYMASRGNALNSKDVFEHSTDGGNTWHSSTSSQPGPPYPPLWPENIKGTTILWNEIVDDDSIHTLKVSTDLGQTWETRAIMNDFIPTLKNRELTNSGSSDGERIISDLHNPRMNWFIKYRGRQNSIQYVYYTEDGGFTWRLLEVPPPSNWRVANVVNFDIKFDYREPGAWYFMSKGMYVPHFGQADTVTEYYVSRDRGKTFTQIPVFGDLIGVTSKAEHFYWIGPKPNSFTGYKVIDSNSNERNVELLQQIAPAKFPLDTSSGYGFGIGTLSSSFYVQDPHQVILPIGEAKYNIALDTVYYINSWLYYGEKNIYEEVFRSGNRGRASDIYCDQGSGTVWLVTLDSERTKYKYRGFRESLWKRKIFITPNSKVQYGINESFIPSVITSYNYPSPPDLIVDQPRTQHTRISLYDILGNKITQVYNGILNEGEYRFRLWETATLSTGTVIISIEVPNGRKTEKIFIRH